MKKILLLIIFIILSGKNTLAFEKKAEDFIVQTTSNAKKIILSTKIDEKEKRKNLEQLALDTVDVSGLAKYTLGESSKTLSEKQILEFVEIFKIFFSKI